VIDWYAVFINAFWILGLAILLAAFSYHYWEAQQTQTRLREQLNKPAFNKNLWLSFILITIGLAGTSNKVWETIIWGIFLLVGIFNFVTLLRHQEEG